MLRDKFVAVMSTRTTLSTLCSAAVQPFIIPSDHPRIHSVIYTYYVPTRELLVRGCLLLGVIFFLTGAISAMASSHHILYVNSKEMGGCVCVGCSRSGVDGEAGWWWWW